MLRRAADQIVFDDDGVGAARLQRGRRLGAAERTDQRLLGRIPVGFGAAGRTVELLLRRRDGVVAGASRGAR